MATGSWNSPRLSADLQLIPLPGGPRDYVNSTDGPVRYVAVADVDGLVLGYLWAAELDDGANFLPRAAAGIPGRQAAGGWKTELRERKHRDLTPVQALAELAQPGVGHARYGWVVPDSLAGAPTLAALREMAGRN